MPFSFIGVWDVNRFAFTYDGDSGSVDYPYTYDTETTALEMAFTDTSMSITNVYTYSDSTPPSSYTQGPYSWNEESAGRIQVTGIEDVMSLYCDEVNENEITCDITYAADDTGILFATRRL